MTPERRERITNVLNNRQPDLTVILENVHDPHNIAAVFRTCDAVGVREIYVLTTTISRHPPFDQKSSASAAHWLTIHQFEDLETCIKAVKEKYTKIFATHLGTESCSLYDLDLKEPVALVFGNERHGVSDDFLKYCDGNFIIPQVGMVRSLNISVACAISLYEAFRQRNLAGFYNGTPRISTEEYNSTALSWKMYDGL
ncbi:MAG: RNA methyltransferase [Flavipsychrobacter sp.]|nr:RNA methyltransferase [Flavipsychrobacter sp.]